MLISASIMCADLANLEKECLKLELAGVDRIHFDIMDGNFVDNIVLGFALIKTLKKVTGIPFEVHLMVLKPGKFIAELLDNGVEYICIHLEAAGDIAEIIKQVREKGAKIGLVINPQTPVTKLEPYLDKVDMITFMTVEPGFAGQTYQPDVVKKIKAVKEIIENNRYHVELEADGHMDQNTIPEVVANGVEVIVAGTSSLFKPDVDFKSAVKSMRSWGRACRLEENRLHDAKSLQPS
jgi:ribulose-phosphate 3-epimerase